MAEGIIAWLNTRWGFGVIAVPEGFVTFPHWEVTGTVHVAQWVTFEAKGRSDAERVTPGHQGDPAEIHGCPQCGHRPIDEGVRVHRGRFQRDIEVYVTLSCYVCDWEQPECLATMILDENARPFLNVVKALLKWLFKLLKHLHRR